MSSRLLLFAMLLLVAGLTPPLFGETTEILATGPDKGTGIPYLQPNVISYFAVTYQSAQPEGGSSTGAQGATNAAPAVRVLFTETEVVAYSQWKSAPCAGLAALRVRESPPVLYYHSPQGWSLFFDFPSSAKTPCSFISVFVERFDYFLGITQNRAISSFPAVLKVP